MRHSRASLHGLALAVALCAGCYRGGARPTDPSKLGANGDWIVLRVDAVRQEGERDCGAAAAAMILGFWGLPGSQQAIRASSGAPPEQALSAGFLRDELKSRGLRAYLLQGTVRDLERELAAGRPILVGVVKPYLTQQLAHYLVVIGMNSKARQLAVFDPASGWREYTFAAFAAEWAPSDRLMLVVLAGDVAGPAPDTKSDSRPFAGGQ